MKNLNLIIGFVIFLLNIIIGLLLSVYPAHTIVITSIVIAVTTILNHLSSHVQLNDAFKVSLPFIFSVLGFIEFLIAFFIKSELINDYGLVSILLIFVIEIIIFIISYTISNNTKKTK